MPNKHFCQGPECHTNPTTDRFLKSKGIIRGRYAYTDMNKERNGYHYFSESDKYFCSQGCKNDWLNTNMESIARRTLPPFIEHRRITEGYEKGKTRWGGNTIQKIGVDNDSQ
jgi:hypothetical protein